MAKNKKLVKNNRKSINRFKKGALCALLGTAMISGGLLVGCDSETGSIQFPAGINFYYGAESPDPIDNPGKVGDFYIETDNGNVWQLSDEGWMPISNIRGPQGSQGVGINNISTKSFCDADENMYMEITFHYSNQRTDVERVYLGHTIYVGSEMTLENALEVVADGGEIVLTKDVELNKQLEVNKKVEIDLAGKIISNSEDIRNDANGKWSLLSVVEGGELVINNTSEEEGAIWAKENDCYAIDIRDGGKCVIENGTVIGNICAIYVYEGDLIINNGGFAIQQLDPTTNDYRFTINCYNANYVNKTANVTINGGYFANFNPANNLSEGANTNYVPEDKKVVDCKIDEESDAILYYVVDKQ